MFTELAPYKEIDNIFYLNIKVIPKSSRQRSGDVIEYNNQNYWKIYLLSPPEDGKANKELIKYLSKKLEISQQSIRINRGLTSQYKILQISNISDNFNQVLNCLIFG